MSDSASTPREVNDVSPTSLSHVVGQRQVLAQVAVALEAAWADNKKFDSALLVGPSGCGKTAVSKVIAEEMASEFHEVLGQAISCPADLNALLLSATDKSVMLIDEAHELAPPYQTALYLALDQRRISVNGGRTGRSPQTIPINDFTLLLATTDPHLLLEPLRNRMKMTLEFGYYSPEELAEIVRQRGRALQWPVDDAVPPLVGQRAKGTPRLALRLLQACRRVCRASGENVIRPEHLDRACHLERLDEIGLGSVERKYLGLLMDGPTRLNVLSSILGLPPRTVSQVTESFLIREGLIVKDDAGRRQLTAKGREHALRTSGSDEPSGMSLGPPREGQP